MPYLTPRTSALALLALLAIFAYAAGAAAQDDEDGQKRPSLSVRLTPRVGLAPLDVRAVAELKNGSDNFEEYYCATIEWDWDDGSRSESTTDCEPYDPATSEIQRRFTARHRYRRGGRYRVTFNLKRDDDVLARASSQGQYTGGDIFSR